MFPPIALFSSLIILVGQIPGYSVSGGLIQSKNSGKPSSSANKHYNTVEEVQELLYPANKPGSRNNYHATIKLARELVDTIVHRPPTRPETNYLLSDISHLSDLEKQHRRRARIECGYDILLDLVHAREKMNKGSGKNEFIGEAAMHPLNMMINDLTDILFESCSRQFNEYIRNLKISVHKDEAINDIKIALINLDRFRNFLKPAKEPLGLDFKNIPFSFSALNNTLIDVNTKLTPEDLDWLGVPQENTLSRNELLERLMERTCNKIEKDTSKSRLLFLVQQYVYYAHEVYKQTGKEYYFRPEFGLFRICQVVSLLMLIPEKKIS